MCPLAFRSVLGWKVMLKTEKGADGEGREGMGELERTSFVSLRATSTCFGSLAIFQVEYR